MPGRLDVMGGIADYSGSLVLQLPLAEAVWAVIQDVDEAGWRVASLPQHAGDAARVVSFDGAEVDALLAAELRHGARSAAQRSVSILGCVHRRRATRTRSPTRGEHAARVANSGPIARPRGERG